MSKIGIKVSGALADRKSVMGAIYKLVRKGDEVVLFFGLGKQFTEILNRARIPYSRQTNVYGVKERKIPKEFEERAYMLALEAQERLEDRLNYFFDEKVRLVGPIQRLERRLANVNGDTWVISNNSLFKKIFVYVTPKSEPKEYFKELIEAGKLKVIVRMPKGPTID